jgi:hypothetical protein
MELTQQRQEKIMNKKWIQMLIAAILIETSASSDGKTDNIGGEPVCPAPESLSTWGKEIHVCNWLSDFDCHFLRFPLPLSAYGYISRESTESIPISGSQLIETQEHWRLNGQGRTWIYYQLMESSGLGGETPTCTYRVCTSKKPCGEPGTCIIPKTSNPCGWSPGTITLKAVPDTCGGKRYDPNIHGCCNGVVYDLNTQDCCNGKIYTPETQACCNNEVVKGESEVYAPIPGVCQGSYFQDGCAVKLYLTNKVTGATEREIEGHPWPNKPNSTDAFFKINPAACPGTAAKLHSYSPWDGGSCTINPVFRFSPETIYLGVTPTPYGTICNND